MVNPLIEKLMKNTTLKDTEILSKSDVFLPKKFYDTKIPILNLALSGSVDGGLFAGVTIIAGPSKHFKSKIALTMLNGFLSDNDNGVGLVYDNEFGTPKEYFDASDIDKDRVVHSPIMNIEELKFDIIKQVSNISKRDEVAILIDSLGNMASKKELEDALKENSAMDMTRAKALKSVFRMITPYLHMRDIPLIGINHTYQTQETYSKAVVSGGCVGKGTLIQTSTGNKPIEELEVGELVNTLNGYKEIYHTWTPETLLEGNPECYEIEFEDGIKIICSDTHKFLINDEWIEAKYLNIDQEVKTV
jgi:hypothetical protein